METYRSSESRQDFRLLGQSSETLGEFRYCGEQSLTGCRYMDGNEAKYTSYFNLAELPQALRVLQLATEYVEACEALIVDSDQSGGDLC